MFSFFSAPSTRDSHDPRARITGHLSQDGGTALYGAVNDLQLEMVELLLSAGASPNISGRIPGPDGSVVDGWTALHAAVSHGSPELVRLLVEKGAHVDATTSTSSPDGEAISEGMTAMCAAAQRGMADIVKARDEWVFCHGFCSAHRFPGFPFSLAEVRTSAYRNPRRF